MEEFGHLEGVFNNRILRGLTITIVINHLLDGMMLQVFGKNGVENKEGTMIREGNGPKCCCYSGLGVGKVDQQGCFTRIFISAG